MGNLSHDEHWAIYGGPPEPGECFPDDPDAIRDQAKDTEAPKDVIADFNAFLLRSLLEP